MTSRDDEALVAVLGRPVVRTALIGLAVTVSVSALVIAYLGRRTEADIDEHRSRIEALATDNPSEVHDVSAAAQLPPPVRRYFDFVFVEPQEPLSFVEMTMEGGFRRPLTEGFSPTTASGVMIPHRFTIARAADGETHLFWVGEVKTIAFRTAG